MRAKFVVLSVTKRRHVDPKVSPYVSEIEMRAVTDGVENKSIFMDMPSGSMTLNVLDQAVARMFEPGQEFYIDFTPAGD